MNQENQFKSNFVNEINGFLAASEQIRIGFASRLQDEINNLFKELNNKQSTIQDLQMQISNMEKELIALRGSTTKE